MANIIKNRMSKQDKIKKDVNKMYSPPNRPIFSALSEIDKDWYNKIDWSKEKKR